MFQSLKTTNRSARIKLLILALIGGLTIFLLVWRMTWPQIHEAEVRSSAAKLYVLQRSHLEAHGSYYTDASLLAKDLGTGKVDQSFYLSAEDVPLDLNIDPADTPFLKANEYLVLLSVRSDKGAEIWVLTDKAIRIVR